MEKSKAQGIGCLVMLGVIAAIWLYSLTEPVQPEVTTLREQGTAGDYTLTIPAGFNPAELAGIAKDRCGTRSHCSVFGWTDTAQTARALPLTEPEVASLAFRYDLNRVTGFERVLFDCAKFPQADKASCL